MKPNKGPLTPTLRAIQGMPGARIIRFLRLESKVVANSRDLEKYTNRRTDDWPCMQSVCIQGPSPIPNCRQWLEVQINANSHRQLLCTGFHYFLCRTLLPSLNHSCELALNITQEDDCTLINVTEGKKEIPINATHGDKEGY